MQHRILIIDDDRKLNRLLTDFLTGFGYQVQSAVRPSEGLKRIRQQAPDLIILDIMLPEMTGFDLCRKIRGFCQTPIVMLTARGDVADRVVGLEIGADDYLAKPFEPRELVARVQAVLRRAGGGGVSQPLAFGPLSVDMVRRGARMDGTDLQLSTAEFTVLALLVRHPGRVFNRDEILQELRGLDSEAFNRTVDMTMSRLRQKLGDPPKDPRFIKTVWGTGYVFIAATEA